MAGVVEPLALIERDYDACSRGDAEGVGATVCADVVHWFLAPNVGSSPVRGAEYLGRYWRKVHGMIAAVWVVDHGIVDEDEAVIEWSMFWNPTGETRRVVTRGAEWFVLRGGRIAEIRSSTGRRHRTPRSTASRTRPAAIRCTASSAAPDTRQCCREPAHTAGCGVALDSGDAAAAGRVGSWHRHAVLVQTGDGADAADDGSRPPEPSRRA